MSANQFDFDLEFERYELREKPRYTFKLDRRRFFKVLGCGMVVLLVVDTTPAQESGGGRSRGRGQGGRPSEISAWLHIGEDGTVTVFTGKTEVGQNVRTSLAQAVAEELPAPPSTIRLVLADTDLVPYDAGTFGSRSTPDMFPQLRQIAAAAREALLDLAAETFKEERASLKIADGKVIGKQTMTFGELTKGQKLVRKATERPSLTPARDWKVAGTSVPKANGRDLVTGKHQFSSDIRRPGMLHGKVLRPSAFEARLASADLEPARKMESVTVVQDGNFVGVAAPDPLLATQALEKIEAKWDTKPHPSSGELFTYLKKNASSGSGGGGRGGYTAGSIPDGLSAAEQKLQQTYTIAYIAHAPLEPRAAVAEWQDGKLTVWTGTQRPFGVRNELSQAFGIPENKVRVIVPDTGSGYGGKHTGEAAIEAARLARAAGKPVKLVWTRKEEFTWAYFRPAGVIEINSGVKKDGTITAWEFHNYNSGGSSIRTPYTVANQKIEFHNAKSPLRQGSYRGLAATANHFARESHMDDLARAIQMDPLEFRLKNLKEERMRAVLEAAAKAFGWGKARPANGHGYGLAAGTEKGSYIATCAEVLADPAKRELKILRVVAAFECGAVVNPNHLKNQVEGSIVMGIGGALFEAAEFAEGKVTNARFADYRVPRFSDNPPIEVVLVNRKDLPSAGAGETPIVGIAPAIRNAILDATGIKLHKMPMVPDGLKA